MRQLKLDFESLCLVTEGIVKAKIQTIVMALLFSFSGLQFSTAALPPRKLDGMISKGSVLGGLAGIGFSLTNMSVMKLDSGMERWVFEISDVNGQKIVGLPGYYNIEMKQNPARLILDFAQMPKISMQESELRKKLAASGYVKKADLSLDPEDSTLNLTLDLKANAKIKVYQVAGKQFTSKVVVDIKKQE